MRRIAITTGLAALVWGACIGDGFAQAPGKAAPEEELPLELDAGVPAPAEPESPGSYLFRALLSLAIVIVVIYLAYYGLRAFRRGRILGATPNGHIEVLDAARLDGDKTLYVVAVGRRVLVLGGAGSQLALVCELDEADVEAFRRAEGSEGVSSEKKRGSDAGPGAEA